MNKQPFKISIEIACDILQPQGWSISLQSVLNQHISGRMDFDLDALQMLNSSGELRNSFKIGRGGHHIWVSDAKTNTRYAIVYYYGL
jgi:hypothetical protein